MASIHLASAAIAASLTLIACSDAGDAPETTGPGGHHTTSSSAGSGGSAGAGGDATGGGATGTGGAAAESCDPYEPRAEAPELIIGPTGMQSALIAHIDEATTSLDVMMYQLSVQAFLDAFIAAQSRGAKVRVLLDQAQAVNASATSKLTAAGVEVKAAPAEFEHAHAKIVVIDGKKAIVDSGNFNSFSMKSERNYAVVDTASDDVADLQAIFERDWSGAALDLSCTRLVVSPENSRDRLLAHIAGAKQSLDFAIMYISDEDARAAIAARAKAGVPVRVLLADPGWIDGNVATATELKAAGAQARFLHTFQLHAKLIVADGVPFVGSENMSWTSLEKNREVGVFVTEETTAAPIRAQFEEDWAAGIE